MTKNSESGFGHLFVVLLLLAGIAVGVYLVQHPTFFKPKASITGFNTIYLEAPEKTYGPGGLYVDSPFTTTINSGQLYNYDANGGVTNLFTGSSLDNLVDTHKIVIKTDKSGNFDNCGSWMHSPSYFSSSLNKTIGWYHAESFYKTSTCPYNSNTAHIKGVGYAESSDNGQTFTKPNYPNNQVLSADAAFANDSTGDRNEAGDFKVIPFPAINPQYYYMFYGASYDSDQPDTAHGATHLARATISSNGKPGSWSKYYNGQFNQAGLGGKSNHLKNLDLSGRDVGGLSSSWVIYDRDINQYIALSVVNWPNDYGLNFSDDALNWKAPQYPFYLKDYYTTEFAYMSLIGLDGDPNQVGNQFYFYRDYYPPGESFANNNGSYEIRQKVSLRNDTNLGAANTFNKIKFNKYESTDQVDDWDTTGVISYGQYKYGRGDYKLIADLGYLVTAPIDSSSKMLYSCYYQSKRDHTLTLNKNDCTGDLQYIEAVGYTVPANVPGAKPIYLCFNGSSHFVSLGDSNCGGWGTKQKDLGYTLFPSEAGSPAPTPTPRPSSTATPIPTLTPIPSPTPTPTPTPKPSSTATPTPRPTPTPTPSPSTSSQSSYSSNSSSSLNLSYYSSDNLTYTPAPTIEPQGGDCQPVQCIVTLPEGCTYQGETTCACGYIVCPDTTPISTPAPVIQLPKVTTTPKPFASPAKIVVVPTPISNTQVNRLNLTLPSNPANNPQPTLAPFVRPSPTTKPATNPISQLFSGISQLFGNLFSTILSPFR